jgi:hypothetical protein
MFVFFPRLVNLEDGNESLMKTDVSFEFPSCLLEQSQICESDKPNPFGMKFRRRKYWVDYPQSQSMSIIRGCILICREFKIPDNVFQYIYFTDGLEKVIIIF